MRGLTLLVATGDAERFRTALTLAAAHAALGGRTRVYFHEGAVRLLASRIGLIDMAIESGASLIACQTGLADAGLTVGDLPEGTETGGLVGILADLGEDRLVTV